MSQESSPKGETDGTRPRQRSTAIKLSSDNKSNKFACCFVVTKNKIQMPLVFHVKICLPQGKSKTWTTERKHTRQNEVKPKNGINTCDDWGVNLNLRLWEGKIRPPVTYNHVRRSSVRRLTQLFRHQHRHGTPSFGKHDACSAAYFKPLNTTARSNKIKTRDTKTI